MKTWYKVLIGYQKENSQGKLATVKEPYLLDAMTFTEAEKRAYDTMEEIISGDFSVKDITATQFIDVFTYGDGDLFYRFRIKYTAAEGSRGKEKTVTTTSLVQAGDIAQAYARIQESLSNMLVTFTTTEITETPIVAVYPYQPDN